MRRIIRLGAVRVPSVMLYASMIYVGKSRGLEGEIRIEINARPQIDIVVHVRVQGVPREVAETNRQLF